jgi:hypothetical protein
VAIFMVVQRGGQKCQEEMEQVRLGGAALIPVEGLEKVDLAEEEKVAPELAHVLAENACVQNVGRRSLMK